MFNPFVSLTAWAELVICCLSLAVLARSAGCKQCIFIHHKRTNYFSPHFIIDRAKFFFCQLCEHFFMKQPYINPPPPPPPPV